MQNRSLEKYLFHINLWMVQINQLSPALYDVISNEHFNNYHMILADDIEYLDSVLDTMIYHCEIAEHFEFCAEFLKLKTLIHKKHKKKITN
jgi:hypothetical protein